MDVRAYGERALLVTLTGLAQAGSLYADLRADPPAGVVDLVPAARTVLVRFATEEGARSAASEIQRRNPRPLADEDGPLVEIPVRYDGADLAEVAASSGLSVAEVIALHTGAHYRVAFIGFAPGFAYLAGLPAALQLPRRPSPRPKVTAGSVAIAGEFSAVYPGESPGGWHLIGTSDLRLWELDRQPPALLQPGNRVRFADVAR
jgi:5-oxoprolinase (ATP-hydrolysing) subunit B